MSRYLHVRRLGHVVLALVVLVVSFNVFSNVAGSEASAAPGLVTLPGTFEVEDYTSFSDSTRGNSGRAYRNDDVDIQRCFDTVSRGTCYAVSWVTAGEWLGYDIAVASGGTFTFSTRVSSYFSGQKLHFEVDGVDVTGPIDVPNTRSVLRWVDVASKPVAMTAGSHKLRLVADGGNFNLNSVTVNQLSVDAAPQQEQPTQVPATPTQEPTQEPTQVPPTATPEPTQVPPTATPEPTQVPPTPTTEPAPAGPQIPSVLSVPGTIEAEYYKVFSDTTPGNQGKKFRNDDVDIEACTDAASNGECYNIAWVKSDEWLGYDIEVTKTGSYTFTTRVASPNDGRSVRFEINGKDVTGQIAVPNTGGYQNWTDITSEPVALTAGKHSLRMVLGDSSFNINYVSVNEVAAPAPAPAPEQDQAPGTNGPTYYVATNGNDKADGSEKNPWRSLSVSMKKLKAGDTLLVRGGTYKERVEVRGESVPRGRADARITVKAYPGEEPLVVGIFWISNADYWTFDNIDVTYDPATNNVQEHMVRMYRGHGWIYENSEIYNAHSYAGLLVNGNSTGWLIRNNYIHDTAPSNALSQDHLIYVSDGSNGIIERNLLVGAPNGRGVKLGNPSAGEVLPANVIVRYNTIVNTGSGNVGVSYDAHDNTIHNNVMINPGEIYYTVHAWYLTGPNNVVRDNLVFGSTKGVTKAGAGLVDGGNVVADPMLDGNYKPTNPAAYDAKGVLLYGHLAGTTR